VVNAHLVSNAMFHPIWPVIPTKASVLSALQMLIVENLLQLAILISTNALPVQLIPIA